MNFNLDSSPSEIKLIFQPEQDAKQAVYRVKSLCEGFLQGAALLLLEFPSALQQVSGFPN